METCEVTQILLAAKQKKAKSFADLGQLINRDEVWVAALFYRQASASKDEAEKIGVELELEQDFCDQLTEYPTKGLGAGSSY